MNNLVGVYFENPEEYKINDDKYLLVIKKFTIMEQFGDTFVNTHGKLRILYNSMFLITHYEFTSYSHKEINPKEGGSFIESNTTSNVVNEFGITPQLSRSLIVRFLFVKILIIKIRLLKLLHK